jgi:AraC-like DNA-binding protein
MTNYIGETPYFTPSDTAYVLDPDRPLLSHRRVISAGMAVQPHCHPRGQLIWATRGVFRVTSCGNTWVTPSSHAVWIPGNAAHEVAIETDTNFHNLYVDPTRFRQQPDLARADCVVLGLTPLMRALILRLCEIDLDRPHSPATKALCELALFELAALPEAPFCLPGGHDPRVRKLTRHLSQHPADQRSAADLSAIAGSSARNLERLFRRDTGLTLREWRTRARLLHALEKLNAGEHSAAIAYSLGYRSPSAFIAAFKQRFGLSPQRFLSAQ